MKASYIFLLITAIYLLGFFAHAFLLSKTIYGDGIFYYSWLHSIVMDHDINFTNEYAQFHVSQPARPNGMPGNKYSIGPALLWAPAFISVHSVFKGTGYELPYQLAVGFTNVALALVGLLLLFNLLHKFFNDSTTRYSITSLALATNLLFYGSIDPTNTHALTFFVATCYLTLLFEKKKRWFLIGITLGLIGLLRPQDLVYGLLLFACTDLFVIPANAGIQSIMPGFRIKSGMTLFSGFILAFLPQLLAWKSLYGSFLANPYLAEGQTFNFLQPKILEVLFSPNHGLFLWTPILLLGFFGLIKASFWPVQNQTPKLQSLTSKLFLAVIIVQTYIVSSWFMWWQGESYSGRMFVSLLPLFAFGLAHLFSRFRSQKLLPYIIGGFSLLNVGSIVYFLLLA